MHKRGQSLYVKGAAFNEIFLLVLATVAFAFIIGQANLVSANNEILGKTRSGLEVVPDDFIGQLSAKQIRESAAFAQGGYIARGGYYLSREEGQEQLRRQQPPPSGTPNSANPDGAGVNALSGTLGMFLGSGKEQRAIPAGVTAYKAGDPIEHYLKESYMVGKDEINTIKGTVGKDGVIKWDAGVTTNDEVVKLPEKAVEDIKAKEGLPGLSGAGGEGGGYQSALGAKMGIPAGWASHLVDGVAWGAGAFIAVYGIASMMGAKPKQAVAMGAAAGVGVFVGQMVSIANIPWWGAALTGAGAAAIIFLVMYKKEKDKTVTFTCLPWEAPTGGKNCEKCNNKPFMPCTEYRCKSLGQACELENKDTPGKEMCVWKNPKDVTSPTITTWKGALKPEGLSYIPDKSIRPPALGVKIERSGANKCLQAFTSLEFGVITNEPSQCKIDLNHTTKFDNMEFYFGESNLYNYNHTQRMKLPGPDIFNETGRGAPIFKNDGSTALFVRCRDANGNENVDEYMISFCVDKSPDTTAPLITGTSLLSGSPVQFGADKVPIEVYTNEPAECKWSKTSGIAFEDMNSMNCASDASEINAQLTYTCSENLTGVKDREDNTFYFKCKDKPGKPENERYVMTQSYPLVLKGSQALNIVNVGPNGTIAGSTETVAVDLTVETSNGAEEGKAVCAFSPDKNAENFVSMFETNNYKHKQTLALVTGDYTYFFKCIDLGGNIDESNTTFSVYVDKILPSVTRVYRDETMGLKVVTNEDADCTYSLTTCNFKFEEGLKLEHSNPLMKKVSGTDWKAGQTYYIKCRDAYGNEPNPNECSVTVKAV